MTSAYQCLNCKYLGRCPHTDLDKLRSGYHCEQWEAAKPEIVQARNHIIQTFGNQGLESVLKTEIKEA